jgi:hypothetical protein
MSTEVEPTVPGGDSVVPEQSEEQRSSNAMKLIGWFSVGLAVAAVGVLVGVELRSRYKFNHRTPYDFYANAGERQASEFGVGV